MAVRGLRRDEQPLGDLAGRVALGGEAQYVDLAAAEPAGPCRRVAACARSSARARWISRRAKCAASPRSIAAPAALCSAEGRRPELRVEPAGELGQLRDVVLAARLRTIAA